MRWFHFFLVALFSSASGRDDGSKRESEGSIESPARSTNATEQERTDSVSPPPPCRFPYPKPVYSGWRIKKLVGKTCDTLEMWSSEFGPDVHVRTKVCSHFGGEYERITTKSESASEIVAHVLTAEAEVASRIAETETGLLTGELQVTRIVEGQRSSVMVTTFRSLTRFALRALLDAQMSASVDWFYQKRKTHRPCGDARTRAPADVARFLVENW